MFILYMYRYIVLSRRDRGNESSKHGVESTVAYRADTGVVPYAQK
jgi:hypothetical protein